MSSTIRLHHILRMQSRRHSTAARKDFFGILDVTTKDVSGIISNSKLPDDKFEAKYKPLKISRDFAENIEVTKDKIFGKMRFDGENRPKTHGQYDPENEKPLYQTSQIAQMYINNNEARGAKPDAHLEALDRGDQKGFGDGVVVSHISPDQDLNEVLKTFKDLSSETQLIGFYMNQPPAKFHFRFSQQSDTNESQTPEVFINNIGHIDQGETKLSAIRLSNVSTTLVSANVPIKKAKQILIHGPKKDIEAGRLEVSKEDRKKAAPVDGQGSTIVDRPKAIQVDRSKTSQVDEQKDTQSQQANMHEIIKPTVNPPKINAQKYLDNIRERKTKPESKKLSDRLEKDNPHPLKPMIKLDSMGFRNYTYQVPDWFKIRHVDILRSLKDSILYHNYDIIAVNKPYGIASHEREREREPIDMNSLMHELAGELKVKKVHLVHRLDKNTTGILLFATSHEKAVELNRLFKSDQITKTYLCIVRGKPEKEHAVIDIPLASYSVVGKTRTCLAPEALEAKAQLSKKYLEARRGVTEYKVIHSNARCSLLEIRPRSGVKHQIRCHLGFGLNCPILGDHKYSHLDKIAPQTLSSVTLGKLRVRQQKVRTLPLHLHARSIAIPGAKANGQTLFVTAPLPAHFSQNMEALGLKLV